MKITRNNILLWSAITAFALTSTGCSIFKPSDKGDKDSKGMTGWVQSGEEAISNAAGDVKDKAKETSGRVKKTTEKAIEEVNEKLQSIADDVKNSNISGDWAIETVLGKKAVGETAPFLKFSPAENRIYGNNGCNIINAEYKIDSSQKTISFGNIASTMMMCADTNITDREVGEALAATASYSITDSEPDRMLTFYDAAGKAVMTLMHRDFHFLDGTWAVEKIDGEKVAVDGMKLALDVDEKRLHGNTGCNIINGELETDMDTANSISFSKIAMTRMACPDSGWETRMTVALEEAVTAKKISNDEIEFIGSNGQQVMLLRRTDAMQD